MTIDFRHNQSAHCENGVTSNLLGHQGVDISEAMAFGIGSGLFFTYMPFLKYNGIPISSFRPIPGIIFKRTAKRLGIRIFSKKFRDPEKSMQALDDALQKGLPVGLQVGVFHLPYFPAPYRFHFNAHNLVVYGRENGVYQVSDPVMETPESLTRAELMRVRWAHGVFQPKGRMYYPLQIPPTMDIRSAIVKGIRKNCTDMLSVPVPYIGIRGIRYLSKKILDWPDKLGEKKASLYLGQIVRTQEEIGTGGAGFRFIYAAFLQEASKALEEPLLQDLSQKMTDDGDRWRDFAVIAGRIIKRRNKPDESYAAMSAILAEIADREEDIFRQLRKVVRSWKRS